MSRPPARKAALLFTPLSIVAAFVSLTEAVLGIALTQVAGGVQIALTVFVLGFPLLVAAAFFFILWNRAYVFYAPSEYGNVNPAAFMSAIRDAPMVEDQLLLAKSVEEDPLDEEARFSLIDTMADNAEVQCVIFMYESGKDLSAFSFYVYADENGAAGSGSIGGMGRNDRLVGTGVVRRSGAGNFISLTEQGKRFAAWLISRGRKSEIFWTEAGGWGIPEPGSDTEKWIENMKVQAEQFRNRRRGITGPPVTKPPSSSPSSSTPADS